jgi:hypothetical protein
MSRVAQSRIGLQVNQPMQQLRLALRYYASLLRPMFGDFRGRWQAVVFWSVLIVSALGAVYEPVARFLSLGWQGLPPWYGLALGVALLVFSFARVNYQHVSSLESEVARHRNRQISAAAAILTDDIVSIERVILPVANSEIGTLIGKSLALRFTNLSNSSLTIRCRLLNLERILPNKEWEPQDWFREHWLTWIDGGTEERIIPGASRDCEISTHHYRFAIAAMPGQYLPRELLAGKWRATLDIEVEPFAVRRIVARFEWRPKAEPVSPGEAFVWIGTDIDTGVPMPNGATAAS